MRHCSKRENIHEWRREISGRRVELLHALVKEEVHGENRRVGGIAYFTRILSQRYDYSTCTLDDVGCICA